MALTKQEFDNLYRDLPRRIQNTEKRISKLEKQKANVPVVKDKVQASEKEFPYTQIRVTVDALDPYKIAEIDRKIRKFSLMLEGYRKRFDELKDWIYSAAGFDIVTEDIFDLAYVQGLSYREIEAEVFLSRQTISRIVRKAIEQNTGKWGLNK